MAIYDPALYADQLSEVPAEQEIAMLVVGQILPDLRKILAKLNELQQTWRLNDLSEMIEVAAKSGELLAGHSAEDWMRWGVVFTELQAWLNTPLAGINATPQKVLLKRYVSQAEEQKSD